MEDYQLSLEALKNEKPGRKKEVKMTEEIKEGMKEGGEGRKGIGFAFLAPGSGLDPPGGNTCPLFAPSCSPCLPSPSSHELESSVVLVRNLQPCDEDTILWAMSGH